jgi:isoleucyl-tRNA synthetase
MSENNNNPVRNNGSQGEPVPNGTRKSQSAVREEEVLKFWQENKIFEKSLEKDAPKGQYVFYDGPPFATGLPHYGHILGSTVKDVIGRYKTMSGFNVPRRWGWDCHGLPIENIVEKDLGISGKKAIENLGIDKFTEHARSKVLTYVAEWKKTIDRMGRWVDFDNSYKTMDNTFIESVWWALGQMNKKGLLYEGVRVLAYCPRCETPIANSEIAMDDSYKDITDISVYVKFKILDEKYKNTYLLAWTTTPWTLPGNTAIAIHKELNYLFIKNKIDEKEEIMVVVKDLFESLKDKFNNPEIMKEVTGQELIGLSYEPIFDYYKNIDIPNKENIWKVWHADFVTLDKGTGIAHEAPAFGEDDMNLAKEHNIPFIRHVENNGDFSKEVIDFPNIKAKPKDDHQSTDVLIIKHLANKGTLFAKEKIIHPYPHCYRCETPLLYYALPSWFINIQKVKKDLLKKANDMNWIPSHLKEGRFKHTMESAPDWTISRNRYWASPLPIWKSESGKIMMVNSIDDLKIKTKKSGNKYFGMRHGEGDHSILNICSGDRNFPHHLTEKGKKRVEETAKKLKNNNITKIFSSPYIRTKETAKIVANIIGFPEEDIIIDDRLKEYDFGEFNGRLKKEYDEWRLKNEDFFTAPNGGESCYEAKMRVANFIYEIESKYSNENILFISHGIVFEVFPSIIKAEDAEETWKNWRADILDVGDYKEFNFIPLPHNHNYELDLHRPYIDEIVLIDEEKEEYKRIPEVVDCWFESGSMPFAQDHFPFENPNWQKENFPSGFVAEYIAQTRTWFYYTHAISTILFGEAPFENVVTTGTVLAEDGSKMSKSKNNYPDPWLLFSKYGVDALRFYLISSPLMKGEDVNFSEKLVQEVSSKIINRFDNVVTFYELYFSESLGNINIEEKSKNILDRWIIARLQQFVLEVKKGMEAYDLSLATKPFDLFIDDLSTWYLRRSRERLKEKDKEAQNTLYFIIKETIQVFAPFMPFIADSIWNKVRFSSDPISVHLTDFFDGIEHIEIETDIINKMSKAREIVSLGLKERQKAGLPVRQPLKELRIKNGEPARKQGGLRMEYIEIIKDELNVKEIKFEDGEAKSSRAGSLDVSKETSRELKVELDINITEELKKEGQYRELLRAIQDMRKKDGLNPNDSVTLLIETNVEGQELINSFDKDEFKKTIGAKDILIKENNGVEIKIDDFVFKIVIEK